jgi:glycosyltransferase involved in cell wall biosynthesis
MSKQKRILCLFDYAVATGFGNVSENIKKYLKLHFKEELQLDICAINFFGEPYQEADGTYVLSASKSAEKHDEFGRYGFLKILQDSDLYDGIFIMQDLGVIQPIIELLRHIKASKAKANRKSFKSMFYFPVDCQLSKKLVEGLEFFDCIVAYNQYGKNEVSALRPELKSRIKIVPHGNNSQDFYPMVDTEIAEFRKDYFGDNASKFIISNISRNQYRKDIPTTIFSFIEIKRRWKGEKLDKEPFLYLHMNPKDKLGWDLELLLEHTPLKEGIDYMFWRGEEIDKQTMNKIYNATDLCLTTTLGEGYGLIFNEAAATRTPIVAPNSTSFIEMGAMGKRAYMIDELFSCSSIVDSNLRMQCDYFAVAEMVIYVAGGLQGKHDELGFREHYDERLQLATEWIKSLEWKDVCESWVTHFNDTF